MSSTILVCHHQDNACDLYAGRGPDGQSMADVNPPMRGWLGNPFKTVEAGGTYTRSESIQAFADAFQDKLENDADFRDAVRQIGERGLNLGCHCRHWDEKEPACHADVIKAHAERLAKNDPDSDEGDSDPDSDDDPDARDEGREDGDDRLPEQMLLDGRDAPVTVVEGVGQSWSYWMGRISGIETVGQLADATIDELTDVSGIGETLAGRFKGIAQGLCSVYRDVVSIDEDSGTRRVGILFGDIDTKGYAPEGVEVGTLIEAIDETIDSSSDVTIAENTQIGMNQPNGGKEVGMNGGSLARTWLDKKQGRGLCMEQPFYVTPDFGLYKVWDNALDAFSDHAETDEGRYKARAELIDEREEAGLRVGLSDIPDRYNVNQLGDASVWMAFDERDRELAKWADVVVIPVVDGSDDSYADRMVDRVREHAQVVTNMELKNGHFSTYEHSVDEDEAQDADIHESDTVANQAYIVTCPDCDSRVRLDGPDKSSRCLGCQDDGILKIVNTSNAGEIIGEEEVSNDEELDETAHEHAVEDELFEVGVTERDESEWASSEDDVSETGGRGLGRNKNKYG